MPVQRRRLPHIYLDNKALFVTWNLHGSVPANLMPPQNPVTPGEAFAWLDRRLDTAQTGPLYLRRPEVAQIVVDCIHHGAERGHYKLVAYVVMANHVHLLVDPKIPPSRFLKTLKGVSAREANKILHRTGEPFWQAESYDHWVRDDAELLRIQRYIENNPMRAGFVSDPAEFPWSSANRRREDSRRGKQDCMRHAPPAATGNDA